MIAGPSGKLGKVGRYALETHLDACANGGGESHNSVDELHPERRELFVRIIADCCQR